MARKTTPLNPNLPMVDPNTGTPSPFFLRWWQDQVRSNAAIANLNTPEAVSAVLDILAPSATHGDVLYRGETLWSRLGTGTSGEALLTQGAAADPAWGAVVGSIDDLSDVDTTTVPPTDGQTLVWSAADSEWKPGTISGGGGGGGTADVLIEEVIAITSTVTAGVVDITGLDLSAYTDVVIYIDNVVLTTDANPAVRIYRGGTLQTTGYDTGANTRSTNTTSVNSQRVTGAFILSSGTSGAWRADTTGSAWKSETSINNLGVSEIPNQMGQASYLGNTLSPIVANSAGTGPTNASAVDGIRICTLTGATVGADLSSVDIRLVGRRSATISLA